MKRTLLTLFAFLVTGPLSFAEDQILDDQEIINVEGLYSNKATIPPASIKAKSSENIQNVEKNKTTSDESTTDIKTTTEPAPAEKIERLTDLNRLAPFKEISVIQKKYMPKTERFQLFAAGGTTTNSPWFLNLGLKLNLGYFFTESFGIELSGIFLSNSEREVSKEIRANNNLQPEKFVNTKNYMGADLVWAPIYGKVTFLNERIVPFDMYFAAGAGSSATNSKEGNNTTFHIGTGQLFSISKSMAFRWDYSWNFYQATPITDSAATSTAQSNSYNDLILTAGISFFFPEVSNR